MGAPRAAYLDFPLGRTSGRPGRPDEQRDLVAAALGLFESLDAPGEIVRLPFDWAEDDAWKDRVMRPSEDAADRDDEASKHEDDRVERRDAPQYQNDRDRLLAEEAMASGGCPTCVFPG